MPNAMYDSDQVWEFCEDDARDEKWMHQKVKALLELPFPVASSKHMVPKTFNVLKSPLVAILFDQRQPDQAHVHTSRVKERDVAVMIGPDFPSRWLLVAVRTGEEATLTAADLVQKRIEVTWFYPKGMVPVEG